MTTQTTISFQELKKWQKNTTYSLNQAFPNYQNSFLIEDAIGKALEELCKPKSKMSFSNNSLTHVAKCRFIDELRRSQRIDYLNDAVLAAHSTPLSIEAYLNAEEDKYQWQWFVTSVQKIENPRRKALVMARHIAPKQYSIKELQTQFNMPSANSVTTEICRGLADLRNFGL